MIIALDGTIAQFLFFSLMFVQKQGRIFLVDSSQSINVTRCLCILKVHNNICVCMTYFWLAVTQNVKWY